MGFIYDDTEFFNAYAAMGRSQKGLEGAGEWHELKKLFPNLEGKSVLDLGCGYGWHSRYCVQKGASQVLGIDASSKMINEARTKSIIGRLSSSFIAGRDNMFCGGCASITASRLKRLLIRSIMISVKVWWYFVTDNPRNFVFLAPEKK